MVRVHRKCSSTHRPQERLLHLFGENVEHLHCLCGQSQIRAGDTLVLGELRLAALLLLLHRKHVQTVQY